MCGTADFVRDAWQWKYRLGGAMRQSGILAAAGLYALQYHIEQLKTDHAHAQQIWRTLSACDLFRFDPAQPSSNILRFSFDPESINAERFAEPDGRLPATFDIVTLTGWTPAEPR